MHVVKLRSLAPICGSVSTKLILGSIQSKNSEQLKQYYAHHQSRFWRVISEKFGISPDALYQDKLSQLVANGYALWDVLQFAQKNNTHFDYNISAPNNICSFLRGHKQIQTLIFNGELAFDLYCHYNSKPKLKYVVLAATCVSDEYYHLSYAELKNDWKNLP